ncbi:transposase IS4 family protein [Streptomyces bottropensis ATCC 25435]|uniref:Transposase IS4 family protein n=1 Tax=Streptomyces bottropensis ATCC 25435 TaxID=1054862 RepID=M3EJ54_9ACTN|nr:transposase IS4 family protein [Streptomyces bottropensis ATCC 25435]
MSCFRQAQLALAHLRKNETLAQLSAGFGVSEATAWRYVDETVDVLAAWAPGLREALTGRGEDDFVTLDGTLIPTDRVAADEPYYSKKHKKHGINVQVVAAPNGTPLWFSRASKIMEFSTPHDLPGRPCLPTHHRRSSLPLTSSVSIQRWCRGKSPAFCNVLPRGPTRAIREGCGML